MAVKLKINKKDPPNKREPIFVSDIKDPRLMAYKDSLRLYENTPMKPTQFSRKVNFTQKQYEDIYGIPKVKTKINPVGFIGDGYYPVYKKPVQPVIFKAKEKEKIEKIEPTAKKISEKKEIPKIKKTPTAVKPSELIYRVEYFDSESGKKVAKFFPNEKQGSEFQKSLSSEQNKYGSRGMYVKNENK